MRSLFRPLLRSAARASSSSALGHAHLSSIPGRPLRGDGRRSRSRSRSRPPPEADPFPKDLGLGSDDDDNDAATRRIRGPRDRFSRDEDRSLLGDFGGSGGGGVDGNRRARGRTPSGRGLDEYGGRPMRGGDKGFPGNREPGGDGRVDGVGRVGNSDRQRFSNQGLKSSLDDDDDDDDDDDMFLKKLDIVGGDEGRNARRGGLRNGAGNGQMGGSEEGEDQIIESLGLGGSMNGEGNAKKQLSERLGETREEVSREVDSGPPPEAEEIFKEMKEKGLIPNAVAMLDGLCKDGLVQEAMKLFGLMREKGTIPEVVIYTAVVEGFCKALKFDDAKRIFRKMQNNGIVPNAFSYKVLVQGLCKGKKLEDSVEFCVEMLEAGHLPNVVTFVGLIELVCSEKGLEEAMSVIKRLRDKGFAFEEKAVREHLDKKGPFNSVVCEAILGKKSLHKLF